MSPLELLAQLARYGNTSFWLVNSAAHNLYALSGAIYCGEVRRGRIYDYTAHSSSTSAILRLRMVISRKRPAIRAMGRCVDQGHLTAHAFLSMVYQSLSIIILMVLVRKLESRLL